MSEAAVKIAVMAVCAVLCSGVVRRGAPEFGLLLALGTGVCILLLLYDGVEQVLAAIERLAGVARLDQSVLRPVVKTVAISILTKITGELCRCAGEGGIAAFVETAGTILALGVALPLAEGVLELMGQLFT